MSTDKCFGVTVARVTGKLDRIICGTMSLGIINGREPADDHSWLFSIDRVLGSRFFVGVRIFELESRGGETLFRSRVVWAQLL